MKILTSMMLIASMLCLVSCVENEELSMSNIKEDVEALSEDEALEGIESILNFTDDREKTLVMSMPSFLCFDELKQKAINKYLYDIGVDYKLEFIGIEDENNDFYYEEELLSRLESGEKTDIFFSFSKSIYDEDINEYAYLLTDYIESEEGKILKSTIPEYVLNSLIHEGEIYALSTMNSKTTSPSYIVNKNLMDKYGFSEDDFRASLDDIYPMLKEVYESESIRPLVHADIAHTSVNYFNVFNTFFIDRESREVSYFIDTPEFNSHFETLYNIIKDNMMINLTYSPIATKNWFVMYDYSYSPEKEMHSEFLLNEEGELAKNGDDYIVVPVSDKVYRNYMAAKGVTVNRNSEYINESLDFMTKLMSDEILVNLVVHGVEGAHFSLDEKGRVIPYYNGNKIAGVAVSYINESFLSNNYLSKALYTEFENKTEIIIELESKAELEPISKFDFNLLIDKEIAEPINEKSRIALKEMLQIFSEEIWEDVIDIYSLENPISDFDGLSKISGFTDRILDDATEKLTYEEVVNTIRNGLDTVGGREVIAEIERILSE